MRRKAERSQPTRREEFSVIVEADRPVWLCTMLPRVDMTGEYLGGHLVRVRWAAAPNQLALTGLMSPYLWEPQGVRAVVEG